ncbi:MAG: gliding motility-associated C-terminal domain-containing protein, partial [Lewinella sp.]
IQDVTIKDIYCNGGDGHIEVSVEHPEQIMYEWRNAAGELVGGDAPEVDVPLPGTYTLTLMDGVRCPMTVAYTVRNQNSFTADIAVEPAGCSGGGSIAINAITGKYPYTVKWYKDGKPDTEEGNPSIRRDLPAGNYALVITDAAGCTIERNVPIGGTPPLTAFVVDGYDDCSDGTTGFITVSGAGGTPPYSYVLSTGQQQATPHFSGLRSGTYDAWIEDANGCASDIQTVFLDEPSVPFIDLGPDRHISMGDSVLLDGAGQELASGTGAISWTPAESLSCSDCSTPVAAPFTNTSYTVTYVTPDMCTVTDSVLITVDRSPRIYVPNAFSPNDDGNNDVFRIYIPARMATLAELMIFDRWGELLWQKDDRKDGAWDGTFRGKPLSVGVYVYAAKVRLPDDTIISLEGSVTLVR